ncbi:MAG: hypothetical protein J6S85_10850 [Methanobrevibacter sp.]|nr:hypothetical protein [Methanobrevibacter sp.]
MPEQNNIKWRIQDEQELRRVARNFNDKLRRLVKENPANKNIYPQFYNAKTDQFESRITIEALKDSIQTRADFNRELNMLKRFSKRGAEKIVEAPGNEYGSKTTVWQIQETGRMVGIVNRKRQERLAKLNLVEMANASGKLGYTVGQMFGMGLASKNKLSPTKGFTMSQTQADIRYKFRALINESRANYHKDRDQILKENYIRTLEQNFDVDDIKDVTKAIEQMPADLFILKFEAKGDSFEFAYPPNRGTDDYNNYVSELKGYWGKKDTSLTDLSRPLVATLLNQ